MDSILEFTDVSIEYRQHNQHAVIVDRLSLQLRKAEIFGLVGESGCGKSTTALAIANLLPEYFSIVSGSINYLGQDVSEFSARNRLEYLGGEIGFIFQDPITSLNPLMKIGDQISEKLHLHSNLNNSQIYERVIEVLGDVSLPCNKEFLNKYPHELSGGMCQRIMIAIALINRPQLIIADEPTTSLDPTIQAQILYLLKHVRDKYQCTVILISHDFGVINQVCDNVAVMYAGAVVERAKVSELLSHPIHPYSIGLMASIPALNKKGQPLTCIPGNVQIADNQGAECVFANRCRHRTNDCLRAKPNLVQVSQNHFVRCCASHIKGGERNAESPTIS